jgi:phenylalanyl-tRNA synthetase beta chain
MKASYNWLKEFVDFTEPPKELAHVLTMAGFEVEAIEQIDEDTVFDIGITPNRPDCLSIRGIARELSAILKIPFKEVSPEISMQKGAGPDVEVNDGDLCSRYSSRLVTGVQPGPSPEWLSKRLESLGIRSTSNIVDITNYVLLEYGQPLHAFDLDKLAGRKIVVKQAGSTGKFSTLDDIERSLHKDMLLIWDAEKPVAIAGVMGGQNTEVSETTINILLESACFKPASVRKTSKALTLSTESSYRFERGVDFNGVTTALYRAAQLISEIAGGTVSEMTDNCPEPFRPQDIPVTFKKVQTYIGADIDETFIVSTLNNLGFKTEKTGEGITVTPPSFRNDVSRDVDIIEEIARIYGYDNIPSTLPRMQMSAAPEHRSRSLIKTIRNSFTGSGFTEAINYSFMNTDILSTLQLPPDDMRRKVIYVRNPLRKEEEAMRTTLVPALLNNVSLNLNRGERTVRFFEISKVFLASDKKLPHEITQAAAVYHKEIETAVWQDNHDSFYDLKGMLENLFVELKIKDYRFDHKNQPLEPYLHPGKACSVIVSGERIGSLGTLHPGVSNALGIKGNLNIMEVFNLEKLIETMQTKTTFVMLPKYPYAERDIAVVVDNDVTVSSVQNEMLGVNSDIIESINLFDVYKGKPLPKDKKSIAFSIRFRSVERTLTDTEVDELHSRIIKRLEQNLNAELRS